MENENAARLENSKNFSVLHIRSVQMLHNHIRSYHIKRALPEGQQADVSHHPVADRTVLQQRAPIAVEANGKPSPIDEFPFLFSSP